MVALYDIAVSGVQQIIAVVETVLRDSVVHEVVVKVQVYHQFGSEHIVDQREVMVLLDIEFRVTIADGNRIGLIDIRIQVRDSRARDTHVVGKAEVAANAEVVLQAGCGHQAAIVFLEVVAVAEVILDVLPSVLIAETCLYA